MIHTKPRCFECSDLVSPADLVFAPVCGSTDEHEGCGSACWHPLCLMKFRERMVEIQRIHREIAESFFEFLRDLGE